MRRISPALLLILAALSVPLAIEMRTVAGFVGVDLPVIAVVAFEVVLLVTLLAVYLFGATEPSEDASSPR